MSVDPLNPISPFPTSWVTQKDGETIGGYITYDRDNVNSTVSELGVGRAQGATTYSELGVGREQPATIAIPPQSILTLQEVTNGFGKFNPPPHNITRSVSPIAFANYQVSKSADSAKILSMQKANRRGYFYQDLDSAFEGTTRKLRKNLWGFQFMFNPNSISHQNSADANTDWTNLHDISNALIGTQTFSINLFLNRTVDVAQLAPLVRNAQGSASVISTSGVNKGYTGRALTKDDILGIVTRGTEYDLEFLYRVVNGEPSKSPTMDFATADFGYLSGIPVWVRLNNQMRYKGIISGLGVNHLMFTPDMVPVVTEVSISFMRIPVPAYSTDDSWYKDRYGDGKVPLYKGSPPDTAPGAN
jgi:hypothetical protein